MPTAIVKYLWEEPVHLEALSAETDPDARRRAAPESSLGALLRPTDYYRGYLAGSHGTRAGLTAIPGPEAFALPLLDALGGLHWVTVAAAEAGAAGETGETDAPAAVLRDPSGVSVLVGAERAVDEADLHAVATVERRYAVPALRRLLARATVLFPEPAHDGWDWSLFSARPVKDRLVAAFCARPAEGVRRFALPYRRARSEHTFYFERWTLDALPEWVEEIG